jgi:hypothetical protein
MAEAEPPPWEISPDNSEEAVFGWVTPRPNRRKPHRGLVRRNPVANDAPDAIWGIYPSGMILPKIYPHMRPAGDGRLYKVEIHRHEYMPVLFITGVYRADSAVEMLGFKRYRMVELALEDDWSLWDVIENDVDRIANASSMWASGNREHVDRHVRYDLEIEKGNYERLFARKAGGNWQFWRMDIGTYAQERHVNAKRIRREGQKTVIGTGRLHQGCRACARLRKPATG